MAESDCAMKGLGMLSAPIQHVEDAAAQHGAVALACSICSLAQELRVFRNKQGGT